MRVVAFPSSWSPVVEQKEVEGEVLNRKNTHHEFTINSSFVSKSELGCTLPKTLVSTLPVQVQL